MTCLIAEIVAPLSTVLNKVSIKISPTSLNKDEIKELLTEGGFLKEKEKTRHF